jgi:hypothetical protein
MEDNAAVPLLAWERLLMVERTAECVHKSVEEDLTIRQVSGRHAGPGGVHAIGWTSWLCCRSIYSSPGLWPFSPRLELCGVFQTLLAFRLIPNGLALPSGGLSNVPIKVTTQQRVEVLIAKIKGLFSASYPAAAPSGSLSAVFAPTHAARARVL